MVIFRRRRDLTLREERGVLPISPFFLCMEDITVTARSQMNERQKAACSLDHGPTGNICSVLLKFVFKSLTQLTNFGCVTIQNYKENLKLF